MDIQNQSKTRNRRIIAILALVLLIILVIFFYWSNSRNNPEGDSLVIKNLATYTQGKPTNKDTLNFIEHALFTTVNLNTNPPVKNRGVDDVLVRDGTFSQEYDDKTAIHTVKFIVDIQSLKQSYDVSYQWSDKDKYSPDLDEWGTVVKCVSQDKVIYKEFKCKDMFSEMKATATDPLLEEILPYKSDFYTIRYLAGEKEDTTVISIQIMTNANSERTKKQFNLYKKEAQDWLVSQGVDLNNYVLIYRNLANDVVVD